MFGFIAAAAGTENDDHQMEVAHCEAEEPAKKKTRSHLESQQTEPDVSKKELELFQRSSFDSHEDFVVHRVKKFRINVLNL